MVVVKPKCGKYKDAYHTRPVVPGGARYRYLPTCQHMIGNQTHLRNHNIKPLHRQQSLHELDTHNVLTITGTKIAYATAGLETVNTLTATGTLAYLTIDAEAALTTKNELAALSLKIALGTAALRTENDLRLSGISNYNIQLPTHVSVSGTNTHVTVGSTATAVTVSDTRTGLSVSDSRTHLTTSDTRTKVTVK